MHDLWHLASTFLVAMLLAACAPFSVPSETTLHETALSQRDCTEVIDTKPESFPFRAIGDAGTSWIRDQYGMALEDIKGGLSANGMGYYQYWKVGQRQYDVTRWTDARESAVVRVKWESRAPVLADMLRCLGDPPLYRAHYAWNPEAIWTYLDLWYPERGIMVTVYITRKTSSIKVDQPVEYVSYVQPGTPEELIPRFFMGVTPGSKRYLQILQSIKPWPGDVTKITIDEQG